jgi:peroxiredoxin
MSTETTCRLERDLPMLKPRQPVPALTVPTVGGGTWSLADSKPQHFNLIVFYRGLHCPICRTYMTELNRLHEEFASRGIDVVGVSTDSAERAAQTVTEWGLSNLVIGYGVSIDKARQWGLYISTSRGKTSLGIDEPALFSEPGIFLVRPDGTLYFATVQTMPFARPHFREMVTAIDFVLNNGYPARGEA